MIFCWERWRTTLYLPTVVAKALSLSPFTAFLLLSNQLFFHSCCISFLLTHNLGSLVVPWTFIILLFLLCIWKLLSLPTEQVSVIYFKDWKCVLPMQSPLSSDKTFVPSDPPRSQGSLYMECLTWLEPGKQWLIVPWWCIPEELDKAG